MKQLLLLLVMTFVITGSQAQKNRNKQEQKTTGYAITASEKGGRGWKEVRFVNMITGEELKSVYQSTQESQPLNARTGKPIAETEVKAVSSSTTQVRKVVNLDQELDKMNSNGRVRHVVIVKHDQHPVQTHKPFATNSAAAAYDKKHERLYYTPMGINQLRYIDLKSGKIYFFEDEPFGVVKGMGDSPKQITRMVIASDGNGYALTNDANNLIRFTTGKKPEITDLGTLTDDGANGRFSVHSGSGFGGDIIADASGNLYLFTANRNVFKISIESKVATYKGTIKGLPQGFSTNGAMVEEGSKVIVASSESTVGYYRVDLNTFQAEQLTTQGNVFNASDLANGNLAFEKQKKEKKQREVKEEAPVVIANEPKIDENIAARSAQVNEAGKGTLSVYPNPVSDGFVKLAFNNQPIGQYQVELLDISGKLIGSKSVNITYSGQVEEFRFPELGVKGSYLIKISSELNKVNVVSKIVVQ